MAKKVTFGEVSRLLKADPERFATAILGEEPTERSPSEVRYFPRGSLVVNTAGPKQGKFILWTDTDKSGDMIDFIRWHHGLANDADGMKQALEIAKGLLGISDGKIDPAKIPPEKSNEERRLEREADEAKRIRVANWIWNNSSATEGRDEGIRYLQGRAITFVPSPEVLRFRRVDQKGLKDMGVSPEEMPKTPVVALVFAARNTAGQITAVQQVFTTEGKKVSFKNPKRTNGHMPGSCVTLGDPSASTKLLLAEGPETALSVYQASKVPTLITLGSSNFTKVEIAAHVDDLVTVSDMELTGVGLASALKTAQYWHRKGIKKSGIALPPKMNDGDYNDVHQKFGEDLVRAGIEKAFYPPEREQDGTILVSPDARAAFYAWSKTGIDVAAKVPPRQDGKFRPLSLDSLVEEHHNRVLIVENPAIEIQDATIRKYRPSLEIVTLHKDSREFRKLFNSPGGIQNVLNAADIYAPQGMGDKEPVFFSLRRADADALDLPGHKTIAIRSSAISRVNLDFMKGREAIVAPLGNGSDKDIELTEALEQAGARTTRLTWQIFRGDEAAAKILRREIPEGFGAAEAAKEGWVSEALRDLIDISRANHLQVQKSVTRTPAGAKKSTVEER